MKQGKQKRMHTWRKFDGYHQTHQLIDRDGKIVGEVYGSEFEKETGWSATDERNRPSSHLGNYTTMEKAKEAVERAVDKRGWHRNA